MRRIVALVLLLSSCALGPGVTAPPPTTTTSSAPQTTTTVAPAPTTTTTSAPISVCEGIGGTPRVLGVVDEPGLAEASGLVYSEADPGTLWTHNDGGSPPRLWAIGGDGTVRGHVEIDARNVDWEDIALGPGPVTGWYVYLGDIGDNLAQRDRVWLHRFPEPDDLDEPVDAVVSVAVRYPDGPADAEALMVDPVTGDAFIVTKAATGRSAVLRIPAGAWTSGSLEASVVATIDLGTFALVTGGDISRDGSLIAVRTYTGIWLWARHDGESVSEALHRPPCPAPAPDEDQGESIALGSNGYATLSEGVGSRLFRFDR